MKVDAGTTGVVAVLGGKGVLCPVSCDMVAGEQKDVLYAEAERIVCS